MIKSLEKLENLESLDYLEILAYLENLENLESLNLDYLKKLNYSIKLSICNRAFLMLKNALKETRERLPWNKNDCIFWYSMVKKQLLTSYNWKSAIACASLRSVEVLNDNDSDNLTYPYKFELPQDCLKEVLTSYKWKSEISYDILNYVDVLNNDNPTYPYKFEFPQYFFKIVLVNNANNFLKIGKALFITSNNNWKSAIAYDRLTYPYKFELPQDCLKVLLVNNANNFLKIGKVLFATSNDVKITYIKNIDEQDFDSNIKFLLSIKLALELVKSYNPYLDIWLVRHLTDLYQEKFTQFSNLDSKTDGNITTKE